MRKLVALTSLIGYLAVMVVSLHHLLVPYRALPPEPMNVTTQL